MLGERIREIRKKKKMTLEVLAGEELTKGMLSLIENNKAQPSMESLAYIAERLGVEIGDLLEEVSTQELRQILEKAEKLYNQKSESETDKYKLLLTLIEPYIEKLTQGYESARLLEIYSRSLYNEKIEGWLDFSNRAAKMYDEMNLTAKRANISIFWAMEKFVEHDYTESLNILLRERDKLEATHVYIDPMTRVDFDYHEAILHYAVGNSKSATKVLESAIHFSKEHRIFFRIDDLYRLAVANALMTHDTEKKDHYSTKLKQYGEFADDIRSTLFYELFQIMSLINEKQDYVKALEKIDHYLSNPHMTEVYEIWFLLEKGKAFYELGHFQEALLFLEKVTIHSWVHHPFDFSLLYITDTYKALCHFELGKENEALQFAKKAVENYSTLAPTPFQDFANETYNTILEKISSNVE
ncbi:DNA-binding protein [Neobacillus bataviensis LMG 21833]|uniref:DNA-binding protein n=1 Tax=Neobacillus bataviensis LMG 21833 TaxID=1117379 RepID=K6DTY2_9BACI|nr:helix-turn-helix transcriptional regulator [Neobacillus bataviensis]EKN71723.1 DNA-binding protein [Neobacillus bataviensis LMG 21833]